MKAMKIEIDSLHTDKAELPCRRKAIGRCSNENMIQTDTWNNTKLNWLLRELLDVR